MKRHISNKVTTSFANFIDQKGTTVGGYLQIALKEIDEHLGKDYAKKHPELVGQFMAACVAEYRTEFQAKVSHDTNEMIMEALFDIAKSVRLLGNGNIERGDTAVGAIEGLAIAFKESGIAIASSLDDISSGIVEATGPFYGVENMEELDQSDKA